MNSASLWSLAGRYDNPIPTRFLAPIDCLKILPQVPETFLPPVFDTHLGLNNYINWENLKNCFTWKNILPGKMTRAMFRIKMAESAGPGNTKKYLLWKI
jgi:hypothetical protein